MGKITLDFHDIIISNVSSSCKHAVIVRQWNSLKENKIR